MNRPTGWFRHGRAADPGRDEDGDDPRSGMRDADFGFTAGAWSPHPGPDPRQSDAAMERPYRRVPVPGGHAPRRQYGEWESGPHGRFGEGDMGSSASQWNDDFRAGGHGRRGTVGFAESVLSAGRPWPAYPEHWGGNEGHHSWPHLRAGWNDPADAEPFEGRLPPGSLASVRRAGPKGYTRSDDRIKDDVCERLCRSSGIEVEDVSVEVSLGCVHLEGTVPHRAMKHRIEDIVERAIGVKDIDNRIRVRRPGERNAIREQDAARSADLPDQATDATSRGGEKSGLAPLIGRRQG